MLIAAALAGCHLGPDYRAPQDAIPATYRATAASAAQAWPPPDWWRGFGSAELNSLIDSAEAYNFDLQAAIARVREADQQVRINGAPLLPTVNANADQSWTRSSSRSGTFSPNGSFTSRRGYVENRSYNANLAISWEIDIWGRLRAQQASYEASALASRFDQASVALTAVTSVATTWFTALAYQDRLAVARRNLADSERILSAIQTRLQVGTASELDVAQQATLVAGIRAQIPALQSSFEQEVNALATLVGRPPEQIAVAAGTLNRLPLPEVAAGLPSELLARRPDVAQAEAQLIAANADIQVARANFFPSLSLTGQGGWESTALSALFGPGTVLAQFSSNLAQTVFDNGQKSGQYEYNKARYDELLADYRKTVVQALVDVEDGLVAYRYATEQEKLEQQAVDTAQRAADIARAQLLAGTSDLVTALQAQSALFNDLDTLAQVRLSRFTALISLYKALGGGWTRQDVTVPPSTIFHGIL